MGTQERRTWAVREGCAEHEAATSKKRRALIDRHHGSREGIVWSGGGYGTERGLDRDRTGADPGQKYARDGIGSPGRRFSPRPSKLLGSRLPSARAKALVHN